MDIILNGAVMMFRKSKNNYVQFQWSKNNYDQFKQSKDNNLLHSCNCVHCRSVNVFRFVEADCLSDTCRMVHCVTDSAEIL